ncbi:hypothetical protein ACFXHA_43445 [Nocardia sp. NPDC059240]|uniref:hypothetical protein n=1 Tax=Nocardia sp. NPDC059240 TaxID=3346786 RepID=UPI003684113E
MSADTERDYFNARGIFFQDMERVPKDPNLCGCLQVRKVGSDFDVKVFVRPNLTGKTRRRFADAAEARLKGFVADGPKVSKGWRPVGDGRWEICMAVIQLG